MKNLFTLSIITLSIISFGGCKNKEVQSRWTDQTLSIGGNTAEWENIPVQLFENPNIDVRLGNNTDNLYVMVGLDNQFLTRMFHRTGITMWLDKNSKKKKEFGIRFRGAIPREMNENVPPERRERFKKLQEQKEIKEGISIVTKNGNEIVLPPGSFGPSGAVSYNAGLSKIKFVIPLQKTGNTPYAVDVSPGGKFNLGVEMGQMSQEDLERMREQRGGMRGEGGIGGMGGRGGMGGGGRRGGMGRPGGMEGQGTMQKTDLWVTVLLANKAQK